MPVNPNGGSLDKIPLSRAPLVQNVPLSKGLFHGSLDRLAWMDNFNTFTENGLRLYVWPADCHWAIKNGLLDNEDTTGGGYNIRVRNLLVKNVFVRYKGMVRYGAGNHIYLSKPDTVTGALTGDGYILGFATGANNRVEIYRVDDGTATLLATTYIGTLEDNVLYLLELYYKDGDMMCRLFTDGKWYEATITDTTYKPPFEVGTWCQYDAAYDDLEVHRI